ncbi:MAG TPA: hypothetical protein DCG52_02875 [Alphaproteobacteria bacterium]|nr:hypothetical protein [Alphaproteobacteria bacterium]|tara:strand:+ start:436 stop:1308 length:873 start_codon:yes stop_codon:yes gene_type:complete
MKITNNAGIPQPIVDAIKNDTYSKGKADISVTQLIAPAQIVALERKHEHEIEEDASDRIYALLGQAVHTILERSAGADAVTEERLFYDYQDWILSGQIDRIEIKPDKSSVTIQDWKIASVWEYIYGIKPERIEQLNCYAQLYRDTGWEIPVTKLETVFIFRDWQKSKAKRDEKYPQQQIAIIDIPLWADAKAFINQRMMLHQSKNAGKFLCTDEDRWKDPTKWAVKKSDRQRAVRVFDNYEEALEFVEDPKWKIELYLEERPSVPKRCVDYCSVAPFCNQYQKELKIEAA